MGIPVLTILKVIMNLMTVHHYLLILILYLITMEVLKPHHQKNQEELPMHMVNLKKDPKKLQEKDPKNLLLKKQRKDLKNLLLKKQKKDPKKSTAKKAKKGSKKSTAKKAKKGSKKSTAKKGRKQTG